MWAGDVWLFHLSAQSVGRILAGPSVVWRSRVLPTVTVAIGAILWPSTGAGSEQFASWRAAVEVVSKGESGTKCLGIVVVDGVVTASHCTSEENYIIAQGAAPIAADVVAVDKQQDVALLVPHSRLSTLPLTMEADWGDDEQCGVGLLRKDRGANVETWEMVPTFVTVVKHKSIETYSPSRGGCLGDSGGALLGCDGWNCVLMGMLRRGAARCAGHDNYASWPAIAEMLSGQHTLE